jgi:hypothetical protein
MDALALAHVTSQDREMSSSASTRPYRPKEGDIVASRPTARADLFAIGVVPRRTELVPTRYDEAVDIVRTFAREHAVDGWYTCDHTHFALVARHRRPAQRRSHQESRIQGGS